MKPTLILSFGCPAAASCAIAPPPVSASASAAAASLKTVRIHSSVVAGSIRTPDAALRPHPNSLADRNKGLAERGGRVGAQHGAVARDQHQHQDGGEIGQRRDEL